MTRPWPCPTWSADSREFYRPGTEADGKPLTESNPSLHPPAQRAAYGRLVSIPDAADGTRPNGSSGLSSPGACYGCCRPHKRCLVAARRAVSLTALLLRAAGGGGGIVPYGFQPGWRVGAGGGGGISSGRCSSGVSSTMWELASACSPIRSSSDDRCAIEAARTLTMVHELPLSRWISAISGKFSAAEVLSRQRPGWQCSWMNAATGQPAAAGLIWAW